MSDTIFTSEGCARPKLLDATHAAAFLEHLRSIGYAENTLRKKRPVTASFIRWAGRRKITIGTLHESHFAAFATRSPRRRKRRVVFEQGVLQLFIGYLRSTAEVPTPPLLVAPSPASHLLRRYVDYLRDEKGLSERSICIYAPRVSGFLTELTTKYGIASPVKLDAKVIQEFLLDRTRDRSCEYTRLLAASLRSFLGFLFLREETAIDFSFSVPMVKRWRQATVPTFLSPEDVERVLSATNRTIPCGRRDHAILLLLARLGLRAGEIVTLELGDIRWRAHEIIVHGKGRIQDRLPLLADIGKALALYLHKDRGDSASRRVFLRMKAPRREGLAGPAAVGGIVRSALTRAGMCRTSRGAAHIFRHSLATRMIRYGASIAEISEVLRHRSQGTTSIYAKVDFESLREVARPWPCTGAER